MPWDDTRELFPITKSLIYLNHAGVAPISTRVREALAHYARLASEEAAFHYAKSITAEIERVRGQSAKFLGAEAEEIAFVANTTEGLNLVANGLAWKEGDRIVTCDLEYPSNVYPWWNLRDRGVETILLAGENCRLPFERIEAALRDPKVRLLSLSSVEFGSGARNDLDRIGQLCRERNVLFCVDAIQSLGCFSLDVRKTPVDFLAADGHKWLLGPEGCALFFCTKARLAELRPKVVGWGSVKNPLDFDHYALEFPDRATKFEAGTPNVAGIFGLGAAIDLLLELGVEAIGNRILSLTDHLVEGLRSRQAIVLSPRDSGEASGIVSFLWGAEPPERTLARLRDQRIFAAVRRGGVRISPHFYNHIEEIESALAVLEAEASPS